MRTFKYTLYKKYLPCNRFLTAAFADCKSRTYNPFFYETESGHDHAN